MLGSRWQCLVKISVKLEMVVLGWRRLCFVRDDGIMLERAELSTKNSVRFLVVLV